MFWVWNKYEYIIHWQLFTQIHEFRLWTDFLFAADSTFVSQIIYVLSIQVSIAACQEYKSFTVVVFFTFCQFVKLSLSKSFHRPTLLLVVSFMCDRISVLLSLLGKRCYLLLFCTYHVWEASTLQLFVVAISCLCSVAYIMEDIVNVSFACK